MSWFSKFFSAQAKTNMTNTYVSASLIFQLWAAMLLTDKFAFRIIGTTGPSMLPTLDTKNNLVLVDAFTKKFIRKNGEVHKGEIIVASNPYKEGATLVKRVKYVAGEMATFYSIRDGKNQQVYIPAGHVWIEGDNPD